MDRETDERLAEQGSLRAEEVPPMTTKTTTKLLRAAPLLLVLAVAANAGDFRDRDALIGLLTLDEEAPLADAEEAVADAEEALAMAEEDLAAAQSELADAEAEQAAADAALGAAEQALAEAEAALVAAEQALADGLAAALPPAEIEALEAAVAEATDTRDLASDDVDTAQADADAAASAVADAQTAVDQAGTAVDTAQMAVDEAAANLQAILDEIEGTEEFVSNLDDDQVFALNRALNNAVHSGLLPLDLDLDLLQRIIDEDFGNREIQALTQGIELEARFALHAARFEAKAEASGDDRFLGHAERMRDRGEALKEKFLARLDGAGAVASQAASDAADDATREAAAEQAQDTAGEAAREAAHEGAKGAAGAAAREIAQELGRGQAGR